MKTETKIQQETYSVPGCNLEPLLAMIEKLNKRCRRLGISEVQVQKKVAYHAHLFMNQGNREWVPVKEVESYRIRHECCMDMGRVMTWYTVGITGTAPKYAGWEFIATLEPLPIEGEETVNLIMTVPGETCPTEYRKPENVGRCDHCKAKRYRKQTFVVRHEDGTTKVVGRQCIKDFLGHADPNTLAKWAELLAELGSLGESSEDEGWMGDGYRVGPPSYDLEFFLGWTAGVIRGLGWMSRGRAETEFEGKPATVDRVSYFLGPKPKFSGRDALVLQREYEEDLAKCTPTDEDKREAAEALEWALALNDDESTWKNDYLSNLAALARAGVVEERTWGLGGSIIAAYARAKAKALKTAGKEALLESKHFGTIKKREIFKVRVERIIPTEGQWGLTLITKMLAWDGERYANDCVWFASKNHGMEEGGEYDIKATVKDHGSFNGRLQTVLNRVVVLKGVEIWERGND